MVGIGTVLAVVFGVAAAATIFSSATQLFGAVLAACAVLSLILRAVALLTEQMANAQRAPKPVPPAVAVRDPLEPAYE